MWVKRLVVVWVLAGLSLGVVGQEEDVCLLQKETGPCRALAWLFAFNSELGKCEPFGYGGCGGETFFSSR